MQLTIVHPVSIEDFVAANPYESPTHPSGPGDKIKIEGVTQVAAFRELIDMHKQVPAQVEYARYYWSRNEAEITGLSLTSEQQQGLFARVLTAWATHVMEFHMAMMLLRQGRFESLSWREDDDVRRGLDIVVLSKGIEVGVRLFYDTPRARNWNQVKEGRKNGVLLPARVIDFPLSEREAMAIGNMHLYPPHLCQELLEEIDTAVSDCLYWDGDGERN